MKLIVKKTTSNISHIQVTFDAGSLMEGTKYNAGVAHALEHMVFKGTKTRTAQDINRQISFIGGVTNAFTSSEMVSYYINVPHTKIEKAVEILSDIINNSTIPKEEFDKEIEVIKEELLASEDDVQSLLFEKAIENAFVGRESIPIIGTMESLQKITQEEIVRFKNEFYKNGIVTLVSKGKRKELKKMLESFFGKGTSFKAKKVKQNWANNPLKNVKVTKKELEHAYSLWMYPIDSVFGKITPKEMATEQLLLSILGSGMDSRLFEEVREKHGLCYGISAGIDRSRSNAFAYVSTSSREENIPKIKQLIHEQLSLISSEYVSDEELERRLNQERASTFRMRESAAKVASIETMINFYDLVDVEEYDKIIETVSKEDIREYARKIFRLDREIETLCVEESV